MGIESLSLEFLNQSEHRSTAAMGFTEIRRRLFCRAAAFRKAAESDNAPRWLRIPFRAEKNCKFIYKKLETRKEFSKECRKKKLIHRAAAISVSVKRKEIRK
ncbi:MAG: hypothetical protein LLG09_03705 [Negativicutes bacterium]|nr:hypothetical protein [Negativicutes bacterium]